MEVAHLDLSPDDIPPEFDFFGAHQYCTGNCACNPKADAKCNSEMECVCPSPYTGVTCEECVEGYTFEESNVCIKDECANCPGACVNGKCQAASPCECGDYGECVKNKCKCQTGYIGEKCDSCEGEELVFPDCAPCRYDLLPANITYSEIIDKGKNGLNRKGEFQFSAERVEKKTQSISFRIQKGSMVQIDITDTLKDTKVLIADFTRKPVKPLSDETDESVRSVKWYLQGGRQYSIVIVGKARQRCATFAVDISIAPSDPPAELPKAKKEEESVTEKSSTPEQSSLRAPEATDCQGHGRRRADGSCACDVGYIGSSCGKCDDGFEMRPSGACMQKVAPPISLSNVVLSPPPLVRNQPETNWTTTIVGLCVCVICFYAVYRIYQAKSSGERWRHRPLNSSGFDGPDDEEEEEERRSLHERSRRRAQDPTL